MLAAYLAATGVLAVLVLLPGPDFAIVTRFTLNEGRRAGLRAACGVVLGLVAWGGVTLAGLGTALAASAEIFDVLRLLGCAYLLFLGVRLLWRGQASPPRASGNTSALRAGLLTNLLNPKIAVFYSAVLPSLVPGGAPASLWLLLLLATHVALSLAWLAACAALLAASGRFAKPGFHRTVDRVAGVVLIALGIRVAVLSR